LRDWTIYIWSYNETVSFCAQGYALVEYENFKEASAAKLALDGTELLGATIKVDWAFMKRPRRRPRRT
jgi:RNA-binding protein 8A